jgi:heme exporter protein D
MLSIFLSVGFNIGFNIILTFVTFLIGVSLVAMILSPYLQREKLLSEYRQLAKRRRLIKA